MNISSLLQGLASFAWIAFFGVLVLVFVRASRNQPAKGLNTLLIILLVSASLLTIVGMGLVFLQADEYAVVKVSLPAKRLSRRSVEPRLALDHSIH